MAIDPNHTTTTATAAMATTTATSTVPTTTTRPIRPISSSPVPPNLYPSQALPIRTQSPSASPAAAAAAHHNQGVLYPVASSGRGFIPRPSWPATAGGEHTQPISLHLIRPNYNLAPSPLPPPIKGLPLSSTPEVAPSSVPDSNGFKDIRDKSRDDNLAVIRGRKVRMTDGASLYVHCRSWLRNGFPEECQPQYGDTVRSLPKPSPIPMASATLPKKEEGEQEKQGKKDDNEDEDEEYIQRSSPHDLLKRHVKRARKVRARLREERLQRIARYKSRLALLLPPLVEQFRNDLAAGN
ncbi:zinc finger protein jing homolog [Prunus yedoensis var. nudiflora]|uniref:Zinc finger protein jing homolog n=1 Tax=Prunus yedoensis var. nudiflora TaxID=2094558 RepID=A0A314XFN9_PRUYE|nr:zinc finger protein jing homolog [Prunus yedoensis var. nudiflora]